ncbi:MAG: ParA family protein [Planctomycetes bacterium]|nr:ParA family protein [Planctomycetota bacterium]
MPTSNRLGTVITVLNLKGGVGKTHTVWLLASACEERSQRMLAIDADTQGNLSNSFVRSQDTTAGIEALLDPADEPEPRNLILPTAYPSVDIIPSTPGLARFDLADQGEWEQADLHLSFVEPVAAVRELYDLVVFDCPPRLSLVSFAALCASDFVIVPLEAADWGAQGVMQVTAAVDYVRTRFNKRLELLGYLVSRFKRARAYQQNYLRQLREHFGESTFDTVVPDLALFEKSVTDAILLTRHSPASAEADVARRLLDEVAARAERLRRGRNAGGGPRIRHPRGTALERARGERSLA